MAKAPAFQFYPLEFMGDVNVQLMSPEARGAYIFLLCHDWVSGGIPSDDKSLAVLSGTGERWGFVRDQVMKCFQLSNGKFSNARLKRERKKQKDFRTKSAEAGKRGANARWNKDIEEKEENGVPYGDPITKNKNTPMGFYDSLSLSLSSSSSSITTERDIGACVREEITIDPTIQNQFERVCGMSNALSTWLIDCAYPPDWVRSALIATAEASPSAPIPYCKKILEGYQKNGGPPSGRDAGTSCGSSGKSKELTYRSGAAAREAGKYDGMG